MFLVLWSNNALQLSFSRKRINCGSKAHVISHTAGMHVLLFGRAITLLITEGVTFQDELSHSLIHLRSGEVIPRRDRGGTCKRVDDNGLERFP